MLTFYPNPVLHKDSLDYKNRESYIAEVVKNNKEKITTTHSLEQDNLVAELIKSSNANFFTTVVVNRVLYRETFITNINPEIINGKLVVVQEIELPTFAGFPSVYVHTGIANNKTEYTTAWSNSTGINRLSISDNQKYIFPPFCLLASAGWLKLINHQALIILNPDKDIVEGQFKTEIIYEEYSLKIKISMNPRMAAAICSNKESISRAHILSTALTQVLQTLKILHNIKQEEELLDAAKDLEEWLLSKMKTSWVSEDFNASLASSYLWPVIEYQQT